MVDNLVVSLVVAVYRSEPFLHKLLDSICKQTYRNIEVILVDDGSPDNSGSICDEYATRDPRFQVIHQINSGVCCARNTGIDAASGDYLLIIDGDDWLEEDYVEYLLGLAVNSRSDMAMTDKVFTTIDRKQADKDYVEVLTPEEACIELVYPVIPIGPWNKIYKMDIVNNNNLRFTTKWSGEGLYFSCMAAQYSNQICVGHRKVYNYRLNNPNSGLTDYKLEMATNALENIKYIKKVSTIKSERLLNAYNWNIWKNNYYVMFLIIATDSVNNEKELYHDCKKYLRKEFWRTIKKSEIIKKEKIRMVLEAFIPKTYAIYELKKKKRQLTRDNME